ncbi:unnamed protein product (macronuclear) [Paramecium tetraurelia]|uniref:Uncharacterized protein n=1 Tax=Paramecium tetraurelia TaxID=5888 RepID=A0D7X3_PARTE|nr:uncharacterized protein GSPATT00014107001 [Paramecium tetraurelia]CAK79140.1 unnamed protein product [Paramecium tetraurelia]|eukprot:XP_001446537.1 hypothetical protein (macronuclear) [Paramecium tetraurelia strain d4-2]
MIIGITVLLSQLFDKRCKIIWRQDLNNYCLTFIKRCLILIKMQLVIKGSRKKNC